MKNTTTMRMKKAKTPRKEASRAMVVDDDAEAVAKAVTAEAVPDADAAEDVDANAGPASSKTLTLLVMGEASSSAGRVSDDCKINN